MMYLKSTNIKPRGVPKYHFDSCTGGAKWPQQCPGGARKQKCVRDVYGSRCNQPWQKDTSLQVPDYKEQIIWPNKELKTRV